MSTQCTICNHPDRERIDQALVNGASIRETGKMFGVSWQSVGRHQRDGHIIAAMVKTPTAKEIAHADNLVSEITNLKERGLKLLNQAEKEKDVRAACNAMKEIRGILELLAKMSGELQAQGKVVTNTVNVFNAPVFLEFQTVIMKALEPYPEARISVAQALQGVNIE